MSLHAVSFDFGETIATIDTELLARKVERFDIHTTKEKLDRELPRAWSAYDAAIQRGEGGHPWKFFMHALLEAASRDGAPSAEALTEAVDWLWTEQPKENLWRKPIPGMLELCAELREAGVPYGVLSNSEGRLVELIAEMGQTHLFEIVGDSGRLGIDKPDRRIFEWLAKELRTELGSIVHIGDSLNADVEGALSAGMSAIWFSPRKGAGRADVSKLSDPSRARICTDADEVRQALVELGIPLTKR